MLHKFPCAYLFRRCRVEDSTSRDITGSIQVEWSLNCKTWAQNSLNLRHPLLPPPLFSSSSLLERSPSRAAEKETQKAVILAIVSESTCELMRLPSAISRRTRPLKTGRKVPVNGKMEENATRERRQNSMDGVEIEKEMETPDLLSLSFAKKKERRKRHIYIRRSGTLSPETFDTK